MENLPLLGIGSRGEDVRALQTFLNSQGAQLEVDGAFGPRTAQAVAAFQQRAGIPVDGTVGPQTYGAIAQAAQAAPPPQPNPQRTAQVNPAPRQQTQGTPAPVGAVQRGGPLPPAQPTDQTVPQIAMARVVPPQDNYALPANANYQRQQQRPQQAANTFPATAPNRTQQLPEEYASGVTPAQLAQYQGERGLRTETDPNWTFTRSPRPMPAMGPGQNAPVLPVERGGTLYPPAGGREVRQATPAPITPVIHDGPTPFQPAALMMPPGAPSVPNMGVLPPGGRQYGQPQTDATGMPLDERARRAREMLAPLINAPMAPPPGTAPPADMNIPMVQADPEQFLGALMQAGLPQAQAVRVLGNLMGVA